MTPGHLSVCQQDGAELATQAETSIIRRAAVSASSDPNPSTHLTAAHLHGCDPAPQPVPRLQKPEVLEAILGEVAGGGEAGDAAPQHHELEVVFQLLLLLLAAPTRHDTCQPSSGFNHLGSFVLHGCELSFSDPELGA